MKKFLVMSILICSLFTFTACSTSQVSKSEDDLLGTWVTGNESGTKNILYHFEEENGEYKGNILTRENGDDSYYIFDKYEADGSTLTIYGDRGYKEYEYRLKDGYLYIDTMKFTKMD